MNDAMLDKLFGNSSHRYWRPVASYATEATAMKHVRRINREPHGLAGLGEYHGRWVVSRIRDVESEAA